jgi:hypothetical protein
MLGGGDAGVRGDAGERGGDVIEEVDFVRFRVATGGLVRCEDERICGVAAIAKVRIVTKKE